MNAIDHVDDCCWLRDQLLRWHIEATLAEVQRFWMWHSDRLAAGWLVITRDDSGCAEVARAFRSYVEDGPGEMSTPGFNPLYYVPA